MSVCTFADLWNVPPVAVPGRSAGRVWALRRAHRGERGQRGGCGRRGRQRGADNPLPVDLSAALGPEAAQGGTPAESLARLQIAGAPGVRAVRAHSGDIVSLQAGAPGATAFATPCADGTVRPWPPPGPLWGCQKSPLLPHTASHATGGTNAACLAKTGEARREAGHARGRTQPSSACFLHRGLRALLLCGVCFEVQVRVWGSGLQCLAELVPHGGSRVHCRPALPAPAQGQRLLCAAHCGTGLATTPAAALGLASLRCSLLRHGIE